MGYIVSPESMTGLIENNEGLTWMQSSACALAFTASTTSGVGRGLDECEP
jgi:hypothetical protein